MTKTPTVHNPTNFEPAHYIVENVLDNRLPRWYMGWGCASTYHAIVDAWKAEMIATFGENYQSKIHKCVHCGNGNVRWITVTRYIPTGEIVVFGSDCTERLGFANRMEFKLAQLKKKAAAFDAAFRVWNKRAKFLAANPAFDAAITNYYNNPVHTNNSFVRSVLGNLDKYGNVSERQMTTVMESLTKDRAMLTTKIAQQIAIAAKPVEIKGDAPTGRVEVTGEVLSVKLYDSYMGGVVKKMLLKLANNARVFVTVPAIAGDIRRGDTVTVRATFKPKPEDKSFAYGSRPTLVNHISAPGTVIPVPVTGSVTLALGV